jgi:hypothetical protein
MDMKRLTYPLAFDELIIQGATEITPTFRKITVGSPKQVSGVWSIPLGRIHNKVFSRHHAVVG